MNLGSKVAKPAFGLVFIFKFHVIGKKKVHIRSNDANF